MKKLFLLATAIGATTAMASRAQAGISFGIRIGPDFNRPPPVYVAPPVCAPPVVIAPRPVCPPVVYYAPPPRVIYYGYRGHGWKHQHVYYRGHYRRCD